MSPYPILTAHLVLSSRFANIEVAERALIDLADQARFSGSFEFDAGFVESVDFGVQLTEVARCLREIAAADD